MQKDVKAKFAGMGEEMSEGTFQRFNGADVFQTQDYIKLGCETYIDRMLQTHGWDSPSHSDAANTVPIKPEITDKLMRLEGPKEGTQEAKELIRKHGFSYRNLLGELVYAYVVCRVDIGFAVCFLSRFSSAPHDEHYTALKNVCRYLRKYKSWGLIYWRPEPLQGLPKVEVEYIPNDPNLPDFPEFDPRELIGLVDATHATDLRTRRSVTGLVVLLCNTAIAWKSRLMSVVATSSTEAEFLSAVTCAKMIKYFHYILQELDLLQDGPSSIYIDNEAALNMINECRLLLRQDMWIYSTSQSKNGAKLVTSSCPTSLVLSTLVMISPRR